MEQAIQLSNQNPLLRFLGAVFKFSPSTHQTKTVNAAEHRKSIIDVPFQFAVLIHLHIPSFKWSEMVVSERDDELTLFLELRRREKEKEKEKNNLLLRNSDVLAPPLGMNRNFEVRFVSTGSCWFRWFEKPFDILLVGSNGGGVVAPVSEVLPSVPPRKTATEKFLYSENDKSDYDW